MKYVDEFRNAEIARAVAVEIAALTDPDRHYKIMEVCGGHTHTIYRHGIKDLLPEQIGKPSVRGDCAVARLVRQKTGVHGEERASHDRGEPQWRAWRG